MKIYNAKLGSAEVLAVDSPYHPGFVKMARGLNGKFSGGIWTFDRRDEERVRAALVEVYGTDGQSTPDLVDVEMIINGANGGDKDIFALGRQVAARLGRDDKVRLGDGVIVIAGSFPASGGSRKNPSIIRNYGASAVTVLVRDVPAGLARAATESNPEIFKIVSALPAPAEVIELSGQALDFLALLRQRHPGLSSAEIVSAALSAFCG